jgi:hypothetical protein
LRFGAGLILFQGVKGLGIAESRMRNDPLITRPANAADAPALAALSIQVSLTTYATEGVNDLLVRYVLSQFS